MRRFEGMLQRVAKTMSRRGEHAQDKKRFFLRLFGKGKKSTLSSCHYFLGTKGILLSNSVVVLLVVENSGYALPSVNYCFLLCFHFFVEA